jgi:hypothetical protein
MTRKVLATCILAFAFAGVGTAQGAASHTKTAPEYTQAQVKQLARIARAPEQFTTLASYFARQHDNYLRLAAEEKKEWAQLGQNVTSMAAKYPRPADSARSRYEYYMAKANEAGILEAKYSHLAAPDAPVNAQ